jgi:hypothetical protein
MNAGTIIRSRYQNRFAPAVATRTARPTALPAIGEFFKKTRYVPDCDRAGRDVAKDLREKDANPLLMMTFVDHGDLHGEIVAGAGRMIAERMTAVNQPCQNVSRSADMLITGQGDDFGAIGIPATVHDLKFLHAASDARPSEAARRATHQRSAARMFCSQFGSSFAGAMVWSGAPEKRCYADH